MTIVPAMIAYIPSYKHAGVFNTVAGAAGQFIGTYTTLVRHNQPVAHVCVPFCDDEIIVHELLHITDENMKSIILESIPGQLLNVTVANRTL